jgi:hypothetical protein
MIVTSVFSGGEISQFGELLFRKWKKDEIFVI